MAKGEEQGLGRPVLQVKGSAGPESSPSPRTHGELRGPLVVSFRQSHPAVQLGPRMPKSFNVDLYAFVWSVVLAMCLLCIKMRVFTPPLGIASF